MHKRHTVTAAAVALLLAGSAFAQTAVTSHNPALKDGSPHPTTSAAKGHNSFTQAQAKGRLAKAGYTNVSKLTKDKDGVWQGTASKNGVQANVGVDYKGDVVVH